MKNRMKKQRKKAPRRSGWHPGLNLLGCENSSRSKYSPNEKYNKRGIARTGLR